MPNSEQEEKEGKTDFGTIVYSRSTYDFTIKSKEPGQKKDEVLEENLIDVRKLIKNANLSKEQQSSSKKALVTVVGVENYYKKKGIDDYTLIFESRFESGNLAAALKVNDNDYHLLLQNDVNTSGHTQWFFFRVQNTCKNLSVRFNMLNLCKPDSLYNEGMKILIYSDKMSEN